jgi:hypothetical protein
MTNNRNSAKIMGPETNNASLAHGQGRVFIDPAFALGISYVSWCQPGGKDSKLEAE